jgi:hypothetical protein
MLNRISLCGMLYSYTTSKCVLLIFEGHVIGINGHMNKLIFVMKD